jgi:hypothetical protein
MSEKEMLDEERAENDLENEEFDETELDDIDLLQMEEEETDYKAKYEQLFAEHQKTKKALVREKKERKAKTRSDDADDIDARLDARLEMRDFYKNNPEAVDHKEEIEAYQKKGVSREDALYLIERKSGESKKTSETRVVGRSKVNVGFQKVSADEYLKMSASAQQNYNKTSEEEYGELVFK